MTFASVRSKLVLFESTNYVAYPFTDHIKCHDFGMDWQQPEKLDDPLFADVWDVTLNVELVNKKPGPRPGSD